MRETKIEMTDSFQVVGENGKRDEIHEYRRFTAFKPMTGAVEWTKGAREYRMANGNAANLNSDGTFTDIQTAYVWRRV